MPARIRITRSPVRILICLIILHSGCLRISAQTVIDQAVQVSATLQTNPPLIALSWPAIPNALSYEVYRKPRDATSRGPVVAMLGTSATNYTDTNVLVGTGYEYRISKTDNSFGGEGYIYCGIQMPLVESRGKVVLIVDNTYSSNLVMELERLESDLMGDGWTVIRHDVARTNSVHERQGLDSGGLSGRHEQCEHGFPFRPCAGSLCRGHLSGRPSRPRRRLAE